MYRLWSWAWIVRSSLFSDLLDVSHNFSFISLLMLVCRKRCRSLKHITKKFTLTFSQYTCCWPLDWFYLTILCTKIEAFLRWSPLWKMFCFWRFASTSGFHLQSGAAPSKRFVRKLHRSFPDLSQLTFRMQPTKLLCTRAPGSALVFMLPPTYSLPEESMVNFPAICEWSAYTPSTTADN